MTARVMDGAVFSQAARDWIAHVEQDDDGRWASWWECGDCEATVIGGDDARADHVCEVRWSAMTSSDRYPTTAERAEARPSESSPTPVLCPYCERECPRCHYTIPGGFVHIEQPQAPESNAVVCNFQRYVGPMVDVIGAYLEHTQHRLKAVPDGV